SGRQVGTDEVRKSLILAQMKKASQQIGPMALGTMPLAGTLKDGWVIPPANTDPMQSGGKTLVSRHRPPLSRRSDQCIVLPLSLFRSRPAARNTVPLCSSR